MKYRDQQGFNLTPADVDANFRELVSAIGNTVQSSEKGAAGGVATLGGDGKVPAAQLPAVGGGGGGDAIGDILITARNPGVSYLPADGAIHPQASYPALFAELGYVGYVGGYGNNWDVATTVGGGIFYAVGSSGTRWVAVDELVRTIKYSNDGVTWIDTGVTLTFAPTCVDTDRNGVWIIAGYSGNYARSTDNGVSWATSSLGTTEQMQTIATDRAGVWIVAGYGGKMYRSADNGVSWALTDCKIVASGRVLKVRTDRAGVWVGACYEGKITISENNGVTWYSFDGPIYDISSVVYGFNGAWFIVGHDSLIYSSTDLFNTNTQLLIGQGTTDLMDIATDEAGSILIVTNLSFQFMSTDYGETWKKSAGESARTLVAGNVGEWMSGDYGAVMKSIPSLPYNTATSFAAPKMVTPYGLTAYIKAL